MTLEKKRRQQDPRLQISNRNHQQDSMTLEKKRRQQVHNFQHSFCFPGCAGSMTLEKKRRRQALHITPFGVARDSMTPSEKKKQ